jgi:hypothetical protein
MKTDYKSPNKLRKSNMKSLCFFLRKSGPDIISNLVDSRMIIVQIALTHQLKGTFVVTR